MAAEPFLWGQGGTKLTPDQIEAQRKIAAALMKQGMDFSPVGHWSQGLARVAQGVMGAVDDRIATSAEKDNSAYNDSIIKALLGGSGSPSPSAAVMPTTTGAGNEMAATSPAVAGGPEAYRNAIASIESAGSGDYAAVGPTHPKLGRALGRYQIMEANIGPWSQEALGRAVTPEEFMADPKLQDAIFDKKFGGYVQQYGPEGAAQAWIGGPGGVGKLGRKDSLGTSVGAYGSKFLNALGPQVAAATPQAAIEATAPASGYVDPTVSAQPDAPALPAPTTIAPPPAVASVPPQQVAQAMPSQSQGQAVNPAIIRAMTDPRSSPQTQAVAKALLQQQISQQQAQQEMQLKQADPRYQQQLELGRLEIEKARNPGVDGVAVGNRIVDRRTGKVIYEAPNAGQGGFRQATPDEAKGYGAAAGQFGPDGRFYPLNPPQGTSLSVDPTTGAVTFNQGAGVKPLTEAQSKDSFFTTRMTAATPTIDKFEGALMSLPEAVAGAIPMNLGRYAQSEEYQLAKDAGKDFVNAYLRKDSGAALTPAEEANYGQLLLPQPGDKPAIIAAKRQRRLIAIEAIKSGMPASAVDGVLRAIKAVPGADQPTQTTREKKAVINGYQIEEIPE